MIAPRRRPDEATRQAAVALAAGRVAIGAGALLATRPALRLYGFDPSSGPARALGRMVGARDIVLAGLTLAAAGDRRSLRAVSLGAAAADAADASIFAYGGLRGDGGIRNAVLLGTPFAAAAAAVGAWVASRLG